MLLFLLFLDGESVFEGAQLGVSFGLSLGPNFLLLLALELLPLLPLLLHILLILHHQLLLSEFEVLVDFFYALAELSLDLALFLVDFLLSLGLDQRIVLLGAKDWPGWEAGTPRRLLHL